MRFQEGPNKPPTPALIPSQGLVLYSGQPGPEKATPVELVRNLML
jgi:hypothetical protein